MLFEVIHSNNLRELPAEIRELRGLQRLHAQHNRLTQLPAEIGALAGLAQLLLSHNELLALPPEVRWAFVGFCVESVLL